jgi:hypothetical protein
VKTAGIISTVRATDMDLPVQCQEAEATDQDLLMDLVLQWLAEEAATALRALPGFVMNAVPSFQ